jgi:hypothetical protein
MMKSVTPSELKDLFPKQVPKDIINLIDEIIFGHIREAAKSILYAHIVGIINSDLIPEKYFVEKITEGFVEKNGNCFKEFLEKYDVEIKLEDGGRNILYNVHESIMLLICSKNVYDNSFKGLSNEVDIFIHTVLIKMGNDENYLLKKYYFVLENYLDSLIKFSY